MLASLMYHRIGSGKHANSFAMIRTHLEYLKANYPIVLPGDPLPKNQLCVCLTFDDATFDFYHFLFPLLKEMKIRVLLGVPVRYIQEETTLAAEERLSVPYPLMMQDGFFEKKFPFCTWRELREMIQSGYVEAASHSFSHSNLTFTFVNLEREVIQSKKILEERLSQAISSFIYPFGRCNEVLHEFVSLHYPYAFRIGSAFNRNWKNRHRPLSRIPADQLKAPDAVLAPLKNLKYYFKCFSIF
jgi:peptidoglycan/xylan/chitin deacetylase (PgdA/CDA1 family)